MNEFLTLRWLKKRGYVVQDEILILNEESVCETIFFFARKGNRMSPLFPRIRNIQVTSVIYHTWDIVSALDIMFP